MMTHAILAPIFKIIEFLPQTPATADALEPLRERVRALADVATPFTEVEAKAMEARNAERRRVAIEQLGDKYIGLSFNKRPEPIAFPPLPGIELPEFLRRLNE